MSWGRCYSEQELAEIVKRGHVRIVAGRCQMAKEEPRRPIKAELLAYQIREAGLPLPILEYAFDSQLEGGGRQWRIDLAWPALKLAVEVDSAVHRIEKRFKADLAKRQALSKAGWDLLPVSPTQIREGAAIELIAYALANRRSYG